MIPRKKPRARIRVETRRSDDAGALARAVAAALVLLALMATQLVGQQGPSTLSLEEAIELARLNNPNFLSTQNDESAASWQVREAYAQFVPSLNANAYGAWTDAGTQRFGTVGFVQNTQWAYSGYGLTLGMRIDGQSIFAIPNARANKRATDARVEAAEFNLGTLVAFQYMLALRAQDQRDVAVRQRDRALQNQQIVRTRVQTGAAAGTESTQADVDLGRAEVAVVQAERQYREAVSLLAEQIGVELPLDVDLVSEFELFEPTWDREALLQESLDSHPSLSAARAQESMNRAAARQTSTSQYIPSLNLSASFRGQAQQALNRDFVIGQAQRSADGDVASCQFENDLNARLTSPMPGYRFEDCSQYAYTEAMGEAALAQNRAFPFEFTTIPAQVSASLSLPIFNGFTRERQVAQANALADDAEHARRAEELRLRTAVTQAYDNLMTAHRVVQMEESNQELTEEQLQLQQRRYAMGAGSLLELLDAQTNATTADQTYLNAIYDFHYNLIALEAAVGRPLRPNQ